MNSYTKITTHLFTNFIGKGGMALLAVSVTPFYVRLLGIEAYGVIGFYQALTSFFYLFDFGLGDTFCREAARLTREKAENPQELRNLLRTLEIIYWLIGASLSLVLIYLSPWISEKWLHAHAFGQERMRHLIQLMACSFFFLWPFLFYCKGLQGLQAHILHNSILLFTSIFRYLGGIFVLLFVAQTIEYFFYWQILSTLIQTLLIALCTWKKLSMFKMRAYFSLTLLARLWKFSLGMGAIGVTSIILLQADKLIVSKFFSLEVLGHYYFSSLIASSLFYLLVPLTMVYYPLFIQCIEREDTHALKSTYHIACQLVMIVGCPFALLLIFFGKDLVLLWTSDALMATTCAPLISLL